MINNASITKINHPKVTGVLPRKRLFHKIDASRDCPIIWIAAPPGSGKTTLTASYITSKKLPCLWYQIDKRDSDIATFFYYLSMAIKRVIPYDRNTFPVPTHECIQDVFPFTTRYFEELYRILKPPFFIVFDDYHEIPFTSEFHDVIVHGLCIIPDGINVIVISRNEPPPQFIRLRANGKVYLIGWNEIKFTAAETKEVIRIKKHKSIPEENILQLHKKTDGWAAGIVLFMEVVKTKGICQNFPGDLALQEIFDYFVNEVFLKVDKETQTFLLKTALLPSMTLQTAERLTGMSASGCILSALSRNNYFLSTITTREPAYLYHPLFREFLLSRAKTFFTQDELLQLQRNASALMEESGLIEDAAALLQNTGDFEKLVQLIIRHAQSLIEQGRNKTLEGWIMSIPEEIFRNTPWLIYWKGICGLPFNPSESRCYFEDAFSLFRKQKDWSGILLSWSNVVETFVHEFECLLPLDKWISLFDELQKEEFTFPSLEIETRVMVGRFVAMVLRQPHHRDIESYAEHVFLFLEKYNDRYLRMYTEFYLAMHCIWIGNLTKAGMVVDKLYKESLSEDTPPLVQILGKSMKAMYGWLTGATDTSIPIIFDALSISHKTGICQWDVHLLSQGTCAALSAGDLETAKNLLQKMEERLTRTRKVDIGFYHYTAAWYDLLCGSLFSALEHITLSVALVAEVNIPFPDAVNRLLFAQILFELGEHQEAAIQLNNAYRTGCRMKSKLIQFMGLITKAQFALNIRIGREFVDGKSEKQQDVKQRRMRKKHGNEKIELNNLRKAMALGREQGYVNMFGWSSEVMANLCIMVLDAGVEVEYVKKLVRERQIVPRIPPLECKDWPWQFKIYTLGRFVMIREGKAVTFSGRMQKQPLRLLKTIITLGGKEVKMERIQDMLWPDMEGDKAYGSFRTTLHRLRRLLDNEKIICIRGGLITIEPRYCWVDVWAFERILEQIHIMVEDNRRVTGDIPRHMVHTQQLLSAFGQKSMAKNRREEIKRLIEKAKDLYGGDFLPGDNDHYTIATRERLKENFNTLIQLSSKISS